MTDAHNTLTANAPLYTINNPESVIEVYLDLDNDVVRELKCLNYNRCKEYSYPINEYLERYAPPSRRRAIRAELKLFTHKQSFRSLRLYLLR